MAENNYELESGTTSTLVPRTKIMIGALGTDSGDVCISNPMPVLGTISTLALTSASTSQVTATTAGTGILIPSTAANSIYITGFIFNNGQTAGTITLGYGVGATAPTTSAIVIPSIYFAINSSFGQGNIQPIKIPSSNNVLVTEVGGTTWSAFATYYVAP